MSNQNLTILCEQIGWPKDRMNVFEDGHLTRVNVSPKSHSWELVLTLSSPLHYTDYALLIQKTMQAFSGIQTVQLKIQTDCKTVAPDLVLSYFKPFLDQYVQDSPFKRILVGSELHFEQNKYVLEVSAEIEGENWMRTYAPVIGTAYSYAGFPPLQFGYSVHQKENYEAIQQRVVEEDRARAQAIEEAMKTQERLEEAAKASRESGPIEGPVVFGHLIKPQVEVRPMKEIVEEERGVVVAGFVFGAESRLLRNGKTLVELKVTDYTDSLTLKLFSRDNEDVAILSAIKKGMWIKAKGNVQMDTFSKELAMIANDLNELPPKKLRQETYTGEKRRIELHSHTTMSQMDALPTASKLIAAAKRFGHTAIAITDHSGAQSFPEAYWAGKKAGIHVMYGVEANLASSGNLICHAPQPIQIEEETFVVF
ncbi:MAG: PHP domain-containing protein, partial [Bacilli bacterium]